MRSPERYSTGHSSSTTRAGSSELARIDALVLVGVDRRGKRHRALRRFAKRRPMLAASKRTVVCWCMGLTQHHNGVENIQEMVNLLLLARKHGPLGAGALCMRGHSNVQGDRTMGIWEKMDDAFLDRLRDSFTSSRLASTGSTPSAPSTRWPMAAWSVHLARRQFPFRNAGHRSRRARTEQRAAQRAHRHEAQSLPFLHRRYVAAPPLPQPHRARHAGIGAADHLGREYREQGLVARAGTWLQRRPTCAVRWQSSAAWRRRPSAAAPPSTGMR